MTLVVGNKTIATDAQGYLQHLEDWDEAVAGAIAAAEGITMTPAHWQVVQILRDYYAQYRISPAVRVLIKAIARQLGEDKGNSKYLYELFPYGPARQACKIAGLPKPTGCI